MIKKIIAWIVLFILLAFYVVSCSNKLSERYTLQRYAGNICFSWDKYRYGDLFGISFLPEFKFPVSFEPEIARKTPYTFPKVIDLYVVHDSYLKPYLYSDTNFYGVARIFHKELWDAGSIQACLDTSHINILLFETAERSFRDFCDSSTLNSQISFLENKPEPSAGGHADDPANWNFLPDILTMLFNPMTNLNLEFNTFDYHFLTPVRECKAALNYRFFGRVSKEVVISPEKQQLYYYETVDTTLITSSYHPLIAEEVNTLVATLNTSREQYLQAGFDEVFFTIIPNPVTIVEADTIHYNGLIPRVSNHQNLHMPMIDVYGIYLKAPFRVYFRSDTHWNKNGFTIWVNEFHKQLAPLFRDQ